MKVVSKSLCKGKHKNISLDSKHYFIIEYIFILFNQMITCLYTSQLFNHKRSSGCQYLTHIMRIKVGKCGQTNRIMIISVSLLIYITLMTRQYSSLTVIRIINNFLMLSAVSSPVSFYIRTLYLPLPASVRKFL